jgi:hypothetical protein
MDRWNFVVVLFARENVDRALTGHHQICTEENNMPKPDPVKTDRHTQKAYVGKEAGDQKKGTLSKCGVFCCCC